MESITSHHRRLKAVYILTSCAVIGAAVLFTPVFGKFERTGENLFEVVLNGTTVGRVEDVDDIQELLQEAREAVVRDSEEMVFLDTDLTYTGREVIFGGVDSDRTVKKNMETVLRGSIRQTLQHAYTVKINEYTVNLRTSDEVRQLLQTCLDNYDEKHEYGVELVLDCDRELNVLTTSVYRKEEAQQRENSLKEAGIAAYFTEVFNNIQPRRAETFEEMDYGLKELDYADTVEIVDAYLLEEELTSLEDAIEEVTKEQETEQIYEVQPGDTLSQIAQNNGLTVDGLVAINPGLDSAGSMIRAGDELIITVPQPELSVQRQELKYSEESYEAQVQYVDMPEWYTTRQEVVQEPSAGHRKIASLVTYKNEEEISRDIVLEEVDYEAVPKIVRRGTKVPPTFIKPLSGGRLSSNFGGRSAPTKGASSNHKGIDWATPIGTAVMASSGGTVTKAGWGSGYGYCVYIQHEDGKETRYGHLSKVLVSVGQKVSQGQKIALSGNTGRSTGPHVHFEIRINGVAVNPFDYLN